MITKKFDDIFKFGQKSKIKAGDGLKEGKFPFYTSSSKLSKYINKAEHFEKSLIFGTGGSASVHYAAEPFSTSTDCIVAISKDRNFNTKFVFYYLFGNLHILERGFKGAGLKHISKKYIQDIDIPLFDLNTQNKIVAILDKASRLVEKRQQSIDLLDELLRAQFLEMFGDLTINPKNYNLIPFKSIIEKIEAGWSPVCEESSRTSKNEWAVLKQGAVSKRKFNPEENKLLPKGTHIKKKITAQKGDLLFSRKNSKEFVGSAAYVFEEYQNLLLPDTIFNLRYKKEIVSPLFLFYLINDYNFKKVIQNLRNGAAASMPNISQKSLLNLMIPLPGFDEQKRFEKLALKVYENKKSTNDSLNNINELYQSILQRAFSGKLNFDITAELDALLKDVDVKKTENDLISLVTNEEYLLSLVERLNNQKFNSQELYDKAKHAVFQLLKNENAITQEYDSKTKSLKLMVK